jgi:N-acetylglucosamine kinase-like BadF-type ATPase
LTGSAYFLGVDGGGSKTEFQLIDADGRELARAEAGTTDHGQIGIDGAAGRLADGLDAVFATAGVRPEDIAFAYFGLPAYGEDARAAEQLGELPAGLLGHRRYACGNDMVCGWAGSLAGTDGVNVVAGTGSIGYGERQGRSARAGGWGNAVGDEGSGYWIARRALTLFSRMSDGRAPKGPLHAILRAELGLERDLELCSMVGAGGQLAARDSVAALCPIVARAAVQGDAAAAAIFTDAAGELAAIVEAVRIAVGYADEEVAPVSYSGGVFASGEFFQSAFAAALGERAGKYRLTAPILSPLAGAALLAAKLAGTPLTSDAIGRLQGAAPPRSPTSSSLQPG